MISRDPIEELGGINLYEYVQNRPSGARDPLGLQAATFAGTAVAPGPGTVAGALIDIASDVGVVTAIAGAIGIGGAALADAIMTGTKSTASSDPNNPTQTNGKDPPSAQGNKPFNPGRNPDGSCKPCPPPQYWCHPGNQHGSTNGSHGHGLIWNQNPATCMCYPNRLSGPDTNNLK